MAAFILVVAFLLVGGAYFLVQRAGGFSFPWVQFYVRGKESGFSFSEVNLLRRVAIENRLKNPTSLFWSVKTLDRCIRSAIVGFRSHHTVDQPKNMEFLDKLFNFRRRVEFDQPKYRLGISSTRGITPGQTFKITPPTGGVYISKLIENNRKYLAITYPRGRSDTSTTWKDQPIKMYFWRKEDAGYYFESRVIGDYLDRKVPIIHINHSDNIIRAQKRRSVRRDVGASALLFPLRTINQANEAVEDSGGYRCKLLDISEDGAAVAIGGRAKAGLPIKIQVRLNDEAIVISGVIKSVDYKQKNRASVLHIQAQPMSVGMRVRILTYVYGLFDHGETKTDLPGAGRGRASSESGGATEETATSGSGESGETGADETSVVAAGDPNRAGEVSSGNGEAGAGKTRASEAGGGKTGAGKTRASEAARSSTSASSGSAESSESSRQAEPPE